MSKLIPLEEAAGILGLPEDKVAELRSNNEIFGYRDGATWKFKMSELERVADELGITLNMGGSTMDSVKGKIDDAVSELGLALEESDDDLLLDESDSVELLEDSSVEIFADSSDDLLSSSASSLKLDDLKLLDEDDDDSLKLGDSSELLGDDDSDKPSDVTTGAATTAAAGVAAAAAAVTAAAGAVTPETNKSDDSINLSSSSIFDSEEALSFGSSLKLTEDAAKADESSELLLAGEPSSDASGSGTGKDIADSGSDELLLKDDGESAEFSLEDSVSLDDSLSLEDSVSLDASDDLSLQVAGGSKDELSLDDSDSNIDLKLETDESGINLAISESGISLSSEEPLELGGSDIDALQLDDDDDDVIMIEDDVDQDDPTLMQEDDFNLTPLEEAAPVADSTSQVIAMEDSAVFTDESAATVMGDDDFDTEVVDDAGFGDGFGDDSMSDEGLYEDSALAGAGGAVAMVPEISYSKWQLASLGLVATLLLAGSLVAYDLARNLWMPEDQTVGRGVLKFFLGLVNMG